MERIVKIYKGSQINKQVLDRMKAIVLASSYSKDVYKKYYQDISNIFEIAKDSESLVCENVIVMGDDWFLHYVNKDEDIHFLEWVAAQSLNKKRKLAQKIEMLHYVKRILITNYHKVFYAAIRHDTAYQMFLEMVINGYFECLCDEIEIDPIYSKLKVFQLNQRLNKIYRKYIKGEIDDINLAIDNDEILSPKYLNVILHFVNFYMSDKFQDRYCKKKSC